MSLSRSRVTRLGAWFAGVNLAILALAIALSATVHGAARAFLGWCGVG